MTRRLLVPCLAALLFSAACADSSPEDVETTAAVPVVTAQAALGTIQSVLRVTGIVTPAAGAELVVTAPETARILDMPKAEGDTVAAGDLLVRFEIPSASANAAAAAAAVAQARARLENARAARTRAHDLFDRGVAARKEMEDADRDAADAEATLAGAEAALSSSGAISARTTRLATFAGVIARRTHNPGDLVEAGSDPILRVIDPRRLEVAAAIPIGDIPRISVGAHARLVGATGGGPTLRVLTRPSIVDAGAATGTSRLALPAGASLAAGTPVSIEIDAEQHAGVILVPVDALVRDGGDTAVFVVKGTKAERRAVETGGSDGARVEIRSGVAAGEVVIVRGQAGLPDGAEIRVAGTPAGKAAEGDDK